MSLLCPSVFVITFVHFILFLDSIGKLEHSAHCSGRLLASLAKRRIRVALPHFNAIIVLVLVVIKRNHLGRLRGLELRELRFVAVLNSLNFAVGIVICIGGGLYFKHVI